MSENAIKTMNSFFDQSSSKELEATPGTYPIFSECINEEL